jgi:acetolactate decarboxylase
MEVEMRRSAVSISLIGLLILTLALFCGSCADNGGAAGEDAVYQAGTITALQQGILEGDETFADLREHGDFGLGTFNGLDGEMVALEGKFYQIRTDGLPRNVAGGEETPFAVVIRFEPGSAQEKTLPASSSSDELKAALDRILPTSNDFDAVRIDGTFDLVKARSVPAQQKPYPTLDEVVAQQTVYELHEIKGTLIGFRFPSFVQGINQPGYHFHFLSEDRKSGGHMLDCSLRAGAKATFDSSKELELKLPGNSDFNKASFN